MSHLRAAVKFMFSQEWHSTIMIEGTIKASKRNNLWPLDENGKVRDLITVNHMWDLKIQGSGVVDGQGYMWWVREYTGWNQSGRPMLLRKNLYGLEVTGVKWINSPKFHIYARSTDDFHCHDCEIEIEAKGKLELNRVCSKVRSSCLVYQSPHWYDLRQCQSPWQLVEQTWNRLWFPDRECL